MTSKNPPPIILASQSPYRRELLQRLGLAFEVAPAHIDETPQPQEQPEQLALRLAQEKAQALSREHPTSLIIGSDQVAEIRGQALGKPGTPERALEQLMFASGETATFHTGLCVRHDERIKSSVIPYAVHFRAFSHSEAERYIERDKPLDCAGSFKAEALGVSLFQSQSGDDPSALIGLPLITLCEYLREFGYSLP